MFAIMPAVENNKIRVAILDMYEGAANQGMRCIREILNQYADFNNLEIEKHEFDVRQKLETPGLDFDLYISSGGPGSPLESEGSDWEKAYFNWLESVEEYNASFLNQQKKHVFFICHSFQLACRHYGVGEVIKRRSTSFGVFPVHMLDEGMSEPVFEGLKNPFYAVDSRDYQVIHPRHEVIRAMGGKILAIEKERPHVPLPRAIMAMRFNDYFIGTQFHPEADAIGMTLHLQTEEKKKTVIENHGEAKWQSMIEHLNDPDKILWTYSHIIPNFLNQAIGIGVEA
jgi:homoserine O-succinyltransferase/O-acetyltransferase